MILLALFLSGAVAGVGGALPGLGGGIFMVPVLTLLGFKVQIVVATSLVAVIATSAGVVVVF